MLQVAFPSLALTFVQTTRRLCFDHSPTPDRELAGFEIRGTVHSASGTMIDVAPGSEVWDLQRLRQMVKSCGSSWRLDKTFQRTPFDRMEVSYYA